MTFVVLRPFPHDGTEYTPGQEVEDGTFRNQRAMEKARYIQRVGFATVTIHANAPQGSMNGSENVPDATDAEKQHAKEDGVERPVTPEKETNNGGRKGSNATVGGTKYQSRGQGRG
jgi:hypothetical protein